MNMDEIAAMAVAAIAEELKTDVKKVRIISFKEIEKSSLEKYIESNKIYYKKYELGDEINEQI